MVHNLRRFYHNVFVFAGVRSSFFPLNFREELGGHIVVTIIRSNCMACHSHVTDRSGHSSIIVHTVRPIPPLRPLKHLLFLTMHVF